MVISTIVTCFWFKFSVRGSGLPGNLSFPWDTGLESQRRFPPVVHLGKVTFLWYLFGVHPLFKGTGVFRLPGLDRVPSGGFNRKNLYHWGEFLFQKGMLPRHPMGWLTPVKRCRPHKQRRPV